MDTRVASLTVLAKMALMDGVVEPAERTFLDSVIAETDVDGTADRLLELASKASLEQLISQVDKYEDKFFIALRSYLVAHSDQHYDVEEEAFFKELVAKLGISDDDVKLIEAAEQGLQQKIPPDPHPRIIEMYRSSSFFYPE